MEHLFGDHENYLSNDENNQNLSNEKDYSLLSLKRIQSKLRQQHNHDSPLKKKTLQNKYQGQNIEKNISTLVGG